VEFTQFYRTVIAAANNQEDAPSPVVAKSFAEEFDVDPATVGVSVLSDPEDDDDQREQAVAKAIRERREERRRARRHHK
jgi:hypothetical protein